MHNYGSIFNRQSDCKRQIYMWLLSGEWRGRISLLLLAGADNPSYATAAWYSQFKNSDRGNVKKRAVAWLAARLLFKEVQHKEAKLTKGWGVNTTS